MAMSFWTAWRAGAAQQRQLAEWRETGALDDGAWTRAREIAGSWPAPALWRSFLDHLTLWLAVGLLGAALICFVAANWESLGRFARLYGLQGVLVLAALAAWKLGLRTMAGQAALVLAGVVLGGLLALIGQTYQTGADTWQLFALWAALLLPWTIAGAGTGPALLWIIVANVALALWLGERFADGRIVGLGLGAFNLALFALWRGPAQRLPELAGRIGPRLTALATIAALTPIALADIFDDRIGWAGPAWAIGTAAVAAIAWRGARDLAVLALAALSVIVIVTGLLARVLFEHDSNAFSFLLLAFAVLGQVAAATTLLRRLARQGAAA